MTAELSFISVKWIKPLWQKLEKIRGQQQKELTEIGNIFGEPRELAKYYVQPHCEYRNPADYDEDDGPRDLPSLGNKLAETGSL